MLMGSTFREEACIEEFVITEAIQHIPSSIIKSNAVEYQQCHLIFPLHVPSATTHFNFPLFV
jgi:hypothetical protein